MEDQAVHQESALALKFCKHCGEKIPQDVVVCTKCGRQVEEIQPGAAIPQVVINNTNMNANANVNTALAGKLRNKWVALCLCIFLGFFGAHKFYEGKIGMGLLYLFTGGLCGIGCIVDLITIITKPNPYIV